MACRRQNVRFGSEADIALQKRHVRFAPYSDRESVPPQNAMPALLLKADTCSAMLGRVIPIKSPISLIQLHQCVGRFRKAGQSPDRLPQYWLAIGGSQ